MKIFKLIFNKLFIISIAIILQMAIYTLLFIFGLQFLAVQILFYLLSIIVFLRVLTKDILPEQRLLWTALLFVLPVVGLCIFLMLGDSKWTKKAKDRMRKSFFKQAISVNPTDDLPKEYKGQANYLISSAKTRAYARCSTKYFASGEEYFDSLLKDLSTAKKYIFLEFFIIEKGKMLNPILDILEQKVRDGVEVRMMYDDIGSVRKVPARFYKTLRKRGIKCLKFNTYKPFVTNLHNNRDHRKIIVIDGVIGYTGGINLADEYINEGDRDYHWKDTGLKVYGNAVGELAEQFLQLYEITARREKFDFDKYICKDTIDAGEDGYVIPFGTGPKLFYEHPVAEQSFINMINDAKKEILITTPYLIVDHALNSALAAAVLRGVDVKIAIPDIPDKKIIYLITKSNAEYLLDKGVKIYRATGSFLHAKSIVADGEVAIIGTINFDYRSFLHHFENGVWLCKTPSVTALREDCLAICAEENNFSTGVTLGFTSKLAATFLKIFTPLF